RIKILHRLGKVCSVHIGDKAKVHRAFRIVLERLVRHDRTEIGATDSDIDDIANAFPDVPLPFTATDTIGEVSHAVQYSVDFGDDILSVDKDRCIFWGTEGNVQDGPLFGDIDFFSVEHSVDPCSQTGLRGKLQQELKGFIRNTILGVVE